MSKQISFIHAADLHLDSPFIGLSKVPEHIFNDVLESTFQALDNLVTVAIEKKVDFVLLVGDLFDNDKQSLKAQIRLRRAFEELNKHHINVYLSYGNHDYINGNSHPITYPDNVFIFPNEEVQATTFYKDNEALAKIYGFSYENRAVTEKKVDQYKVVDEHIPFHIAMLHGSVAANTEHDQYAPFQLGDMSKEFFDYWALGHIHKREVLKEDPLIIYPGNTQGRNRKETGAKGCYYINLSDSGNTYDFIPLHAIEFTSIVLDASDITEAHQLEQLIREKIAVEIPKVNCSYLIDLTLNSTSEVIAEWKSENLIDDLIEVINEVILQSEKWMYIFRWRVNQLEDRSLPAYQGEHFLGELTNVCNQQSVHDFVKELYQHKEARKFIDRLNEAEADEIKAEAYDLLIHELLKK